MTDVSLNPITSGYNTSKLNSNFTTIQESINSDLINRTGGNNVMGQDLDLNSNNLLNVAEIDASIIKLDGGVLNTSPFVISAAYDATLAKKADLASTAEGKGAEMVAFLQSGTGSVAEAVQDALRQRLHVLSFMTAAQKADALSGAKTLTLTVPIQAAIDAGVASGREVDFQGINAKVGALTIGAGGVLRGNKAKLDFSAAGAIAGFTCGSGVEIHDFGELLGPGNVTYQANSRCIVATGTVNAGSAPTFIDGPVVRGNTIRGWGAYGVYMEHCDGASVTFNKIYTIGYAPIMGLGCTNSHADDNVIDTVGPGTASNAYAVSWSRLATAATETENPRSYDCTADRNNIKNCPIWEGIDTHGGVRIMARDNTFDNVSVPLAFVASTLAGVSTFAPQGCVARGNKVSNPIANVIFSMAGAAVGSTINEYASNCEMSNNEVVGGGLAGSTVNGVMRVLGTKGFKASNNSISGGLVFGICLLNDNLNFSITGGVIKDINDSTVTTCAGVAIRSNNNTGYVGGVTFVRENTGLSNVMANSVSCAASITGCDVQVGPCQFVGDTTSTLTISIPVAMADYVRTSQAISVVGAGTISQVSAATSNLVDITFTKPLPATCRPKITRTSSATTGGKYPDLQVTNVSRTGFRVVARPVDGTSWSASGSLTFNWEATP